MEDEDVPPPKPPPVEEIARRALVLATISCRGIIDGDWSNPDAPDLARRARDWIHKLGLADDLTDWEHHILNADFGSLADRDKVNASWLSEGLVVLAWALQRIALPGFDRQCDPERTAVALGFLQSQSSTVLIAPDLRPRKDLDDFSDFIYNLHWRLRDFGRPYDFRSMASKDGEDPPLMRFGLVLVENDIGIAGKPLHRSEDEPRRIVQSITRERHRASSWLVGLSDANYYEASTDT
jgi:hypothetical protein